MAVSAFKKSREFRKFSLKTQIFSLSQKSGFLKLCLYKRRLIHLVFVFACQYTEESWYQRGRGRTAHKLEQPCFLVLGSPWCRTVNDAESQIDTEILQISYKNSNKFVWITMRLFNAIFFQSMDDNMFLMSCTVKFPLISLGFAIDFAIFTRWLQTCG